MTLDSVPLSVLFVGGTGTISAASVRRAVAEGMDVTVLTRGGDGRGRTLPESVGRLTGDIRDPASVTAAMGERHFDAVVNFLAFTGRDSAEAIELFRGRTAQYIHISTAALYRRPAVQWPATESTLRQNDVVSYAREKIAAEDVLMAAYLDEGFPVTIVRPSHTYDDLNPPLPGGWTVIDRIARGEEMVVHGDGTSLWTLTHADDLAVGLAGLIGTTRSIGEAFHITSDDVYTWDQIYSLIAAAVGVAPRLVHVPSEFFPVAAPDWFWSELVLGDLTHSSLFDTSKIRRHVPTFAPVRRFERAVVRMAAWRLEHPELTRPDPEVSAVLDRLVEGYHRSREVFLELAPAD